MIRGLLLCAAVFWPALAGASDNRPPGPDAFSRPLAALSDHDRATVLLGNALFRKSWRAAPSETTASDGLGPLYNARACVDCHVGDGRGRPPETSDAAVVSLLLRLSPPDPVYGAQIQDRAIAGHRPEGRIAVRWKTRTVALQDGARVELREPRFRVDAPAYGPLARETRLSPRLAPPVFGLGLLEAVAEADILSAADPQDRDGDGISGRANRVWSRAQAREMLGRFGWKAGQASIADQNAVAMANDIGIANRLAPALWGDCTPAQSACRAGPHGDSARHQGAEVSDKVMGHLAFYLQGLAPPDQRNADDPVVRRGEALFREIGCAGCHRARLATSARHPNAALAGRTIAPYSDLLLHDMGEGLADGTAEGQAGGREWRTPPLWGIGLTEIVSGAAYFLHDGRARSLAEAILWHGGEGQSARDRFAALDKPGRDAVIAFLKSL
jgi:CxxC motif-containing protein (DUF1111 family)